MCSARRIAHCSAFVLAGLLSAVASAGQVSLAWDAVPGGAAAGYYVYVGTSTRNYPSRLDAGGATAFTVPNLAEGQTYYFAVSAYGATGESAYSNEVSKTIPLAVVPTTTVLASSTNPSLAGASVTFTVNVTGNIPTGTVNFKDGTTSIAGCAAVALAGSGNTRAATCVTAGLPAGTRSITATYGGNASNAPSTSASLAQVVKAATTTSITSTPNPAMAGTSVTLTATISGASPTGSVAFFDGTAAIGGCAAVALSGSGNSRTATCATSGLGIGAHAIRANYAGNATNAASTSAALTQYVQSAPPTNTFADVPPSHWAFQSVEALAYNDISQGCSASPMLFCPDLVVDRASAAVFIERALHGPAFVYRPTGTRFADVPASHWAVGPIEQFHQDGITSGCAGAPLQFCPDSPVTRASMAAFLLRARFGATYDPGPATGTVFADVPATHIAAAWIEEFHRLGYTTGCGVNPLRYCPDEIVSRAAMAVFLDRVFELAGPP